MGLSASQVKLLGITSRMHDIELQAQYIMNEKVSLATQEDAAYEEYNAALDAKKIQVGYANGISTKYIDATFSNVCGFDESGSRRTQYALTDAATGRMIVEDDVYENYQDYSNDKYSFAWAMLGFVESEDGTYSDFAWDNDDFSWGNWGKCVGSNATDGDVTSDGHVLSLMTDVEREVYNNHSDDTKLSAAYSEYEEALEGDDFSKQKDALKAFRDILYSNSSWVNEIYDYMRLDKSVDKDESIMNQVYLSDFPDEFDETTQRKFQYYVNLFEGIQQAGGCISASRFSKEFSNDNDWFNSVVNSGKAILNVYNQSGSKKGWQETSVATSINENYLKEGQDDTRIKKAEAKYEHELSQIKRKDAQFDKDLSKLETERNALTKEKESIDKVIEDNIDRTFKIFS